MKFEIKSRYDQSVLYTADIPDDTESGLQTRVALEQATAAKADLRGAYLGDGTTTIQEATPEQAIANLDKVREIIIDNKALLEMNHWHDDSSEWEKHTCAEEAVCGTTHCLAGWLQVCSTDPVIRKMEPNIAGIICAPVASKMFFRGADEVLSWLDQRKYVEESK